MDNQWNYLNTENEVLCKLINLINKNPIESKSSSKNEFGYIVEKNFGVETNELPVSDYNGIELKCRYIKSEYPIRLFSCVFDGDNLFELKTVFNKYATKKDNQRKTFNHSFFNTKFTRINKYTLSKLVIDNVDRKIKLVFYDNHYNIIYNNSSWSFDLLYERTNIKINHIVMINYTISYINEKKYYQIKSVDFCKLKSFDDFIKLITYGIIFISSSITSETNELGEEKIYNHGISFVIDYHNMELLFNKTKSIKL